MQACDDETLDTVVKTDLEMNVRYYYGDSYFNGVFHTIKHQKDGKDEIDTLQINKVKYYLSNFELIGNDLDGKTINYQSPKDANYFLLEYTKPRVESTFFLKDVPEGDYHTVSFYVGVDSLKSTSGVDERTGVLDVVENVDMYWTWNSGYIFFKLEGTSPQAPVVNEENPIIYHIGGFGGYGTQTANNLRKVTLSIDDISKVRASSTGLNIFLKLDVKEIFEAVHTIRPAEYSTVMVPKEVSSKIADNIQKAFKFDHLHN